MGPIDYIRTLVTGVNPDPLLAHARVLSVHSSGRILGLLVLPWLALSQVRCQPNVS